MIEKTGFGRFWPKMWRVLDPGTSGMKVKHVPPRPGPFFRFWPRSARGPKRAENPVNHRFRLHGGPTGKKVVPEKVAENHPEQRGNFFFFNFGTPVALGPKKGPAVLLACLVAARRASFTLVV